MVGVGGLAVPTIGSLLAADRPPIDVSGRLANTVVWTTDDEGERLENVSVLGTRVNSYIWQPWFTTVNAEGNVGYRTEDGERDRKDLFLSGGLSLGLLPFSDFPTFLSYRHTERFAELDDIDNDSTGDFYSLNSRMALPGRINLSTVAAYADTEDESEDSVVRDLTVTATRPFDIQSVLLSYTHRDENISDRRRSRSDEDTRLDALRLEHQIAPTRNVNVNSGATLLTAEETLGRRDEDTDQIQAFSVASWRPENQPLLINGAVRALTERVDRSILTASQEEDNITLSGSFGGIYTIMPRFDATLNTSSTFDRQQIEASSGIQTETQTTTVTTNAGLRYASLPRPLLGASYQWNLSNTVGYVYADQDVAIDFDDINDPFDDAFDDDDDFSDFDDDEAATGPTAQVVGSHNLSRSFEPIALNPLYVTLGQTIRAIHESDDDNVAELTHSLRLAHSRSRGARYLSASLSLSDTREFGDEEDELQVANALINSRFSFNRYQSLNGSISGQLARRVDDFTGDERIRGSALGSLQYRHTELFDLERLRFTSTFLVRAVPLDNRDFYDNDNEARWTNRLDYLIGQLTLRLESRTSYRDDEEWAERVLFSLSRGF